jgi:uncharacterized protein YqjF (DUF2071 family)
VTPGPSDDERLRVREAPAARPVMRQIWRHLGFLHWPIDGATVARRLPPGLELDTFEGVAYLGLVPFTIPLSRTPRLGLPLAPAFHEVNLRTYVHRGGRDPGVWFFSLDAASRLAVAGARAAYHLPYFHARMSMEVTGDATISYRSRRPHARVAAELAAEYAPTGPAVPAAAGTREFFLAERYLLYAWDGEQLTSARVHHAPYPLQPAAASDIRETLTSAAGLPPPSGPAPLVHYAREVDVRIYRPRRVPAAGAPVSRAPGPPPA